MINTIRLGFFILNIAFSIIFAASNLFANDGDLIWNFPVQVGYPAIGADGTIYAKGYEQGAKLYAINPNGTQKWIYEAGDGSITDPSIGPDGTIYVGKGNYSNNLIAVNPNGNLKWAYNFLAMDGIYGEVESSLAIAHDGTIYAGVWANNDLYLYAINPDGTKKWAYDDGHYWGGEIGSPVVAADGTVYVVASHHLLAINPDGTAKMRGLTNLRSKIVIGDNETIYLTTILCELIAVNSNGEIKWTFDPSASTCGESYGPPPVIGTDGTIYVMLNGLYAIYPNGIKKWSQPMDSSGHIIGADGNIYIGESILNPDGAKIGTLSIYVHNPALGVDGILYGTSTHYETNGLVAIETSSNGPAASAWPMFQHDLRRTGRAVDITPDIPGDVAMPWIPLLLLDE